MVDSLPEKRSGPLEVAIVAAAEAPGDASLVHESRLVKAALLYADTISLASPAAAMLTYFTKGAVGDFKTRVRIAAHLLADGPPPPPTEADARYVRELRVKIAEYEELQQVSAWTPDQFRRNAQLEHDLERMLQRVQVNMMNTLMTTRVDELGLAMSAGVLTIDDLGARDDLGPGEALDVVVARQYRDFMAKVTSDDATVLPLFDSQSSQLAREFAESGRVARSVVRDAREAALGRASLGSLPGMPDVPMETMLEIRDKTADSRVRLQAAIAEAAETLSAAAWDDAFDRELRHVHRAVIAPALADIQAAVDDGKVKRVLERIGTGRGVLAATVTLGVTAATGMGELTAGAMVGGVAAVADALVSERRRSRKREEKMAKNGFLLVYQAGEQLTKAAKRKPR
jgi:hypothetical protein